MLILTRRVGETLMIGDQITVTILGVKGNQVRVGVHAPKDVSVHREEIYERIQKETDESSGPSGHATRSSAASTANSPASSSTSSAPSTPRIQTRGAARRSRLPVDDSR